MTLEGFNPLKPVIYEEPDGRYKAFFQKNLPGGYEELVNFAGANLGDETIDTILFSNFLNSYLYGDRETVLINAALAIDNELLSEILEYLRMFPRNKPDATLELKNLSRDLEIIYINSLEP